MRTHDGRVAADVTTEAIPGTPPPDVPAGAAPNVRVAPSPARRRPSDAAPGWAATGPATTQGADAAPDADARDRRP